MTFYRHDLLKTLAATGGRIRRTPAAGVHSTFPPAVRDSSICGTFCAFDFHRQFSRGDEVEAIRDSRRARQRPLPQTSRPFTAGKTESVDLQELLEADEGTRTLDLLHGKCEQPFAPFAPVRSNRLFAEASMQASEQDRTRANAEPCHSCHGTQTRSRRSASARFSLPRASVRTCARRVGMEPARTEVHRFQTLVEPL
jgi:hypothetical protein